MPRPDVLGHKASTERLARSLGCVTIVSGGHYNHEAQLACGCYGNRLIELSPAHAASPDGTAGSPGVARICLTDSDVHLKPQDEIVIPATTVFEDNGPNTGKSDDPSTWHYEIKEGFKFSGQDFDFDRRLTSNEQAVRGSKCANANGQVGGTETTKRAADKHIFVIDDVLDYPIPATRPPVEIGKLIDYISVEAMLISDVTQAVARPGPAFLGDVANAARCLAGAKKLAAYLGGGTGQQRSMNVEIGHVGAASVTYGCPFGPKQKPDFAVYWDGKARPPTDIAVLIAKGGEFVTGATRAEITSETSAGISLCRNGSCWRSSKPFAGGESPIPHERSGGNLGPIRNQSAGLDSKIITSVELSPPRGSSSIFISLRRNWRSERVAYEAGIGLQNLIKRSEACT
jgi:hypothetical protein